MTLTLVGGAGGGVADGAVGTNVRPFSEQPAANVINSMNAQVE
jgi:hypothetical protein